VALIPGAEEKTLGHGDEVTETQGALVLENLVGEFLTNLGA
jgi:phospholipid/cholesterol/gamma-HCH transport system substrate-binding protein